MLLWVLSLCFIWVVTGLYALWFLQGYTQKHLASLYVYSVVEDAEVMERRRFLIGECARLSKEIEGLEHQRDKVLEVRKAELGNVPLGSDKKVFLPIMMVCPVVSALKRFRSLGNQ